MSGRAFLSVFMALIFFVMQMQYSSMSGHVYVKFLVGMLLVFVAYKSFLSEETNPVFVTRFVLYDIVRARQTTTYTQMPEDVGRKATRRLSGLDEPQIREMIANGKEVLQNEHNNQLTENKQSFFLEDDKMIGDGSDCDFYLKLPLGNDSIYLLFRALRVAKNGQKQQEQIRIQLYCMQVVYFVAILFMTYRIFNADIKPMQVVENVSHDLVIWLLTLMYGDALNGELFVETDIFYFTVHIAHSTVNAYYSGFLGSALGDYYVVPCVIIVLDKFLHTNCLPSIFRVFLRSYNLLIMYFVMVMVYTYLTTYQGDISGKVGSLFSVLRWFGAPDEVIFVGLLVFWVVPYKAMKYLYDFVESVMKIVKFCKENNTTLRVLSSIHSVCSVIWTLMPWQGV